ncbi:MAG: modification methylase, partial [Betaproteobacteria bacterium]|nr:modification methylase [Betaproteobacteria bacterium]
HTDKHGVVMRYNGNPPRKKKLDGDGDFRSEECVGILTGTDIVVTNPPFSLFREFVAQLIQYKKNFLIIGNINAITYKEIFPLIKENNLWLGVNSVKEFKTPGGGTQKFGNVCWFTNLPHEKRERGSIPLFKKYSRKEYPKYDNYDAINVEKVKDIPCDHYEAMGVPISFLSKYNPQQFDLLDANDIRVNSRVPIKPHGLIKDTEGAVSGKRKYARIVIRRK